MTTTYIIKTPDGVDHKALFLRWNADTLDCEGCLLETASAAHCAQYIPICSKNRRAIFVEDTQENRVRAVLERMGVQEDST